jgi:dephospho-CoA kinase
VRVGIVGTMMSGKTSLANLLVDDLGFERVALADPVKDDCVAMLNHSIWEVRHTQASIPNGGTARMLLDRRLLEDNKPVFRAFLQWYGTNFWREFMGEPEHWLWRLKGEVETREAAKTFFGTEPLTVTDDVRFINEAEFLRKQMGYRIIRIVRPEKIRQGLLRDRYPDPAQLETILAHPSETEVPNIRADKTLDNDFRTIADLAEWVRHDFMEWIDA